MGRLGQRTEELREILDVFRETENCSNQESVEKGC
jgi:hypothetical protein